MRIITAIIVMFLSTYVTGPKAQLIAEKRAYPFTREDQDCTRVCHEGDAGDCPRNIFCDPNGFCQGLFVEDEYFISMDSSNSQPLSCQEAADLLVRVDENISEFGNMCQYLLTITELASGFPDSCDDADNFQEELAFVAHSIDSLDFDPIIIFNFFGNDCEEPSEFVNWGSSIEEAVATIHDMGGVTELNDSHKVFVWESISLIRQLERKLSRTFGECNLLNSSITKKGIFNLEEDDTTDGSDEDDTTDGSDD